MRRSSPLLFHSFVHSLVCLFSFFSCWLCPNVLRCTNTTHTNTYIGHLCLSWSISVAFSCLSLSLLLLWCVDMSSSSWSSISLSFLRRTPRSFCAVTQQKKKKSHTKKKILVVSRSLRALVVSAGVTILLCDSISFSFVLSRNDVVLRVCRRQIALVSRPHSLCCS